MIARIKEFISRVTAKAHNGECICFAEDAGQDAGRRVRLAGVPIQIFRAGDYGAKGRYTVDDLRAMVRAFAERAGGVLPKVTVHHRDDAEINGEPGPFGLIAKLEVQGDKLLATFSSVAGALQRWIDERPYAEPSAEIYPAGRYGAGPVLRGVSFVTQPEVKGMDPLAAFSDAGGEYYAFDAGASDADAAGGIDNKSNDKPNENLIEEAIMPENQEKQEGAPIGVVSQEELAAAVAAAEARGRESAAAEFGERVGNLEARERRARIKEALGAVKSLPPSTANYPGLLEFCESLGDGPVKFGEGDGAKSEDPLGFFVGFMEHAAKTGMVPVTPTGADDAAPAGGSEDARIAAKFGELEKEIPDASERMAAATRLVRGVN